MLLIQLQKNGIAKVSSGKAIQNNVVLRIWATTEPVLAHINRSPNTRSHTSHLIVPDAEQCHSVLEQGCALRFALREQKRTAQLKYYSRQGFPMAVMQVTVF